MEEEEEEEDKTRFKHPPYRKSNDPSEFWTLFWWSQLNVVHREVPAPQCVFSTAMSTVASSMTEEQIKGMTRYGLSQLQAPRVRCNRGRAILERSTPTKNAEQMAGALGARGPGGGRRRVSVDISPVPWHRAHRGQASSTTRSAA